MNEVSSRGTDWRTLAWLFLLIALSAALTTWFACITPFVAFGVIAATALPRRSALGLAVAVWLANQTVGYGVLHYPWTVDSAAWGVAIGGATVIGLLTAHWTAARLRSSTSPVRTLAAFVSAFALYELALYAAAASILGGNSAFAPGIVAQVFLVNAVTLVGLYGLNQLAATAGVLNHRRRADASAARVV